MSGTWRKITLGVIEVHLDKHRRAKCRKCGKRLRLGMKVYRHLSERRSGSYTTYYCPECFRKLWH
jgi:RNase P subunit RPR2